MVFAIDAFSRYVFVDFIKVKSDVQASVDRIIAAFDATVGTPTDSSGRALPRPRVRLVHSDREGGLVSDSFSEYRARARVHHTTSPPHDHDLNAVAERTIGVVSERAVAVRLATEANPRLWPYIVSYVVDHHNSSVGSGLKATRGSSALAASPDAPTPMRTMCSLTRSGM